MKELAGHQAPNSVNLDAMIVPDKVLHPDQPPEVLARLSEARRVILQMIAGGQIRFVVAGGVKFKLERWEDG